MGQQGLLVFCIALSALLHSAALVSLPYQPKAAPAPAPSRPLEITYQQMQAIQKMLAQTPRLPDEAVLREEQPSTQEFLIKKMTAMGDLIKNEILKKEKPAIDNKDLPFKKTVNMPNIPGEIARSPEYKNYYTLIRERIRRLAYYHYKKIEEGDVFLTFSINAQGTLLESDVNENQSAPSAYLRGIALQSVNDAAPYPEFPEKLKKNDKLSFNVIISFEVK